jgi:hypothetical protein
MTHTSPISSRNIQRTSAVFWTRQRHSPCCQKRSDRIRRDPLRLISTRFNETAHSAVGMDKKEFIEGDIDADGHILSLRMMHTYVASYCMCIPLLEGLGVHTRKRERRMDMRRWRRRCLSTGRGRGICISVRLHRMRDRANYCCMDQ